MSLKILSGLCTILVVITSFLSIQEILEAQNNCMGGMNIIAGAFGFLITLPFSLIGVMNGISLIRNNKSLFDKIWAMTVLIICGIVFLIALFGTMKLFFMLD